MSTLNETSETAPPTPGAAEGTDNVDEQSLVPPTTHTPGTAEGEDKPELTEEEKPSQ
jgi:hypothetical protein